MGTKKEYMRTLNTQGSVVPVQALTSASTATPITNFGVTTLTFNTTGPDKAFKLARPVAGLQKTIIIRSASTAVITIRSVSTAVTFSPTTSNLITTTTGAKAFISLVGLSSTQWGITGRSTGLTLSGSTLD